MTLYGSGLLTVIFGAILLAFDLALFLLTPSLTGALARMAPERRASAVLAARFAPLAAATFLSAFVVLPSWWRFEPKDSGEQASPLLILLAVVALLPLLQGAGRAALILLRTRHRLLFWRGRGRARAMDGSPYEVVEVQSPDLSLCVGGYFRPTIFASNEVVDSLEPAELSAALAHEVSHAQAHDPLRLLWMRSCPDFLHLFGLDEAWRHAFSSASEFAADAEASAGDPGVALELASALLKVARLSALRLSAPDAEGEVAVSSAFSSRADLEARVLALSGPGFKGAGAGPSPAWVLAVAGLGCFAALALGAEQVHGLAEGLGRFLAP